MLANVCLNRIGMIYIFSVTKPSLGFEPFPFKHSSEV